MLDDISEFSENYFLNFRNFTTRTQQSPLKKYTYKTYILNKTIIEKIIILVVILYFCKL